MYYSEITRNAFVSHRSLILENMITIRLDWMLSLRICMKIVTMRYYVHWQRIKTISTYKSAIFNRATVDQYDEIITTKQNILGEKCS